MFRIKSSTAKRAAVAEIALTGKRYCTAHQGTADAAGGIMLDVRGTRRFICGSCYAKRVRHG